MKLPKYRPREVNQAVHRKVPLEMRSGKEPNGYYCLDGKKRFRVFLVNEHTGGSITPGTLKNIIKSLRLSTEEFVALIDCSMSGGDYERIMRAKIADGSLGS